MQPSSGLYRCLMEQAMVAPDTLKSDSAKCDPAGFARQNGKPALAARAASEGIPRYGLWLMLVGRPALALLAQALCVAVLWRSGDAVPFRASAPWFMVYASLMDLGCIGLLTCLTRREGLRLRELLGFERGRFRSDVLLGIALILPFLAVAIGGAALTGWLIFGSPAPPNLGSLPLLAGLYAVFIWPVGTAVAEDMTYYGYALPRLEAFTGKVWLVLPLVAAVHGFQRVGEPFRLDAPFFLWRAIQFFPLALLIGAIYLKRRGLLPQMIGHWGIDVLAGLGMGLLPTLTA